LAAFFTVIPKNEYNILEIKLKFMNKKGSSETPSVMDKCLELKELRKLSLCNKINLTY
jgi:hypothetical protein